MKWTSQILVGASLLCPAAVLAQDSICDKYTKALLKDNTGSNQYGLLVKIVNTALIGNYTQPNKLKVNGILVPGKFMGENVTLLPYFNGGFISSNRGNKAQAINFIDDGGALALAQDKPADGTSSNQYKLVTHLYQFFGALLGCSKYGMDGFAAYQGNPRMYELHKFMNLGPMEMGYFIQEVGLSAASFGVVEEDILGVAMALNNTFNQRCSPKAAVLPNSTPELQAICLNEACPVVATGAVCSQYNKLGGFGIDPATATSTIGPQVSDLVVQLNSISAGEVTATGDMSSGMMGGAMSFTTSDVSLTTSISGSETVIATETVIPIGGAAFVTTGMETITTDGSTITREYTSTIPASVVEMATTVISTDGSAVTSTFPTTVANPAADGSDGSGSSVETVVTSVITSGGSTFTSIMTTDVAAATTTSPNAAPIQTVGPMLMAIVGAGFIGQML